MGANTRVVNTPNQAFPNPDTLHDVIEVTATAGSLASAMSDPKSTHVMIQVQDAAISVTFDGSTNPTSSVGFVIPVDTTVYWPKALFLNAIAKTASGTANLQVQEMTFK